MVEKSAPVSSTTVDVYGWHSSTPTYSQSYINPALLRILRVEQPARLLDLGCGNGSLCFFLHSHGFAVVGMEPDGDGISIAREQLPSTAFYQLGVDSDPALITATEGLVDAVVSTEVIEHLYAPHLLPRFAWHCLRPGGILIVTTPYHGYLKNLAFSLAGKWDHHHTALWHGGHIKFWSRCTLTKLLTAEGFLPQQFLGVGRLPWLWNSMVLVMRKP
jgi:2-polyprenyl-6-hydroxyphenyl methylase/3-demethylubiquinone-9 3-methyltransferase